LRNPLGSIIESVELLESERHKFDEESRILLDAIQQSGETGLAILTNLLDLNRIDQGKLGTEFESLDLLEEVSQVAEQYGKAAKKKEITFQWKNSPSVRVKVDNALLQQCLQNLISNALKYSPAGGLVELSVREDGEYGYFDVTDHGCGIKEEEKKHLFTKFGKLSNRPTGGESSTGLGLAIVKRLVEGMGGEVSCESTWGEGSTFSLRLPLA